MDGGVCSTYGKDDKRMLRFWWENLSTSNVSKDLGVGGRIIINSIATNRIGGRGLNKCD